MESDTLVVNQIEEKEGSALSGILLVGGTSIGAGMLALPAVTGIAGFVPGLVVNTVCWLFMLATGLLFLEATLWMEEGSNLLSMAKRLLGPVGKLIGGVSFIFLYYCLLVSYIAGGTPILVGQINDMLSINLAGMGGYLFFAFLVGLIVYFGHRVVDRMNWLLMMSLILSYFLLVTKGSTEVVKDFLLRKEWSLTLVAAPVLFSAYGYHNIVPTLSTYLKRNVNKLRLAIVGGTAIPLLVYTFWQWMIIGSIPQEQILAAASNGIPITYTLQEITGNQFLSVLGAYFGFFALVTSFLGVSLSMVDFFADGLRLSGSGGKRITLCLLVFLPPAVFAAYHPGIFIEALGVAGGFGEAILNGLFPIAMVWMGRYHLGLKGEKMVPGGRLMLGILTLFTLVIIGVEIQHLLMYTQS